MAADLVRQPSVAHTFVHDLESAFWVLLWVTLSYTSTSWGTEERSSFLKETMSPRVYNDSGGSNKAYFMQSDSAILKFSVCNNPVLTTLLISMKMTLAVRYQEPPSNAPSVLDPLAVMAETEGLGATTSQMDSQHSDLEQRIQRFNNLVECLRNHKVIIGLMRKALELPGWPNNDAAVLQDLITSDDVSANMRSNSKRSRSVAEGNGVFVLPPPAKRSSA
jgi:hypothetical protein